MFAFVGGALGCGVNVLTLARAGGGPLLGEAGNTAVVDGEIGGWVVCGSGEEEFALVGVIVRIERFGTRASLRACMFSEEADATGAAAVLDCWLGADATGPELDP